MKSTLISKLSLALLVAAFFTSCQKEMTKETTDLNLPTKSGMTANEEAFIQNLQRSISSPNNKAEMRSDDVANPANPLDYVGANNRDAVKFAIDAEKQRPAGESPDFSRFSTNVQNYLASHPLTGNGELVISSEFQEALQFILKSSFLQDDRLESIADVKLIEQFISSTNLLSQSQKNAHYIYAASLRYMKDFLETYDIYLGNDPTPNGLPTWEDLYAQCLNEALNDWENHPISTGLAWADLPGTMAGCALDATWQIATR